MDGMKHKYDGNKEEPTGIGLFYRSYCLRPTSELDMGRVSALHGPSREWARLNSFLRFDLLERYAGSGLPDRLFPRAGKGSYFLSQRIQQTFSLSNLFVQQVWAPNQGAARGWRQSVSRSLSGQWSRLGWLYSGSSDHLNAGSGMTVRENPLRSVKRQATRRPPRPSLSLSAYASGNYALEKSIAVGHRSMGKGVGLGRLIASTVEGDARSSKSLQVLRKPGRQSTSWTRGIGRLLPIQGTLPGKLLLSLAKPLQGVSPKSAAAAQLKAGLNKVTRAELRDENVQIRRKALTAMEAMAYGPIHVREHAAVVQVQEQMERMEGLLGGVSKQQRLQVDEFQQLKNGMNKLLQELGKHQTTKPAQAIAMKPLSLRGRM